MKPQAKNEKEKKKKGPTRNEATWLGGQRLRGNDQLEPSEDNLETIPGLSSSKERRKKDPQSCLGPFKHGSITNASPDAHRQLVLPDFVPSFPQRHANQTPFHC